MWNIFRTNPEARGQSKIRVALQMIRAFDPESINKTDELNDGSSISSSDEETKRSSSSESGTPVIGTPVLPRATPVDSLCGLSIKELPANNYKKTDGDLAPSSPAILIDQVIKGGPAQMSYQTTASCTRRKGFRPNE